MTNCGTKDGLEREAERPGHRISGRAGLRHLKRMRGDQKLSLNERRQRGGVAKGKLGSSRHKRELMGIQNS